MIQYTVVIISESVSHTEHIRANHYIVSTLANGSRQYTFITDSVETATFVVTAQHSVIIL